MPPEIYSIGHSNHPLDRVVGLLRQAGVTAIADVRSSPFSKRSPWFNQREFKSALRDAGLAYAFLGKELGGRPKSSNLFRAGVADYGAMAATPEFKSGIDRLMQGRQSHRIAMVCSERDPLHCHRCLLVGRQLSILGVNTCHIHGSGHTETQVEAEERLLREEKLATDDLLWPQAERLSEAYSRRNRQVAYSLKPSQPETQWPIALQ